jgi:hypothetical protein
MSISLEVAVLISTVLFAGYGIGCFVSKHMIEEFNRYQLPQARMLTGALQILASIGMVAGFFYRPLLILSSAGLAAMMFIAVLTRIKIRDTFWASMPATSLFALNLYIAVAAYLEK